jgi:hypothetical protein
MIRLASIRQRAAVLVAVGGVQVRRQGIAAEIGGVSVADLAQFHQLLAAQGDQLVFVEGFFGGVHDFVDLMAISLDVNLNFLWKIRGQNRFFHFSINAIKMHDAIFTNPNFTSAFLEIQIRFVLHFVIGITRRQNLNTNFGRYRTLHFILDFPYCIPRRPSHIGNLRASGRSDRALGERSATLQ